MNNEEDKSATEEGTDLDKLTPYKTDLEYLDDHFQLIMYKKIELEREDELQAYGEKIKVCLCARI